MMDHIILSAISLVGPAINQSWWRLPAVSLAGLGPLLVIVLGVMAIATAVETLHTDGGQDCRE